MVERKRRDPQQTPEQRVATAAQAQLDEENAILSAIVQAFNEINPKVGARLHERFKEIGAKRRNAFTPLSTRG